MTSFSTDDVTSPHVAYSPRRISLSSPRGDSNVKGPVNMPGLARSGWKTVDGRARQREHSNITRYIGTATSAARGGGNTDNIIEVNELVKVYNGNVRAVDGISFHVERGEVFGFLGPNGAGKGTAIEVLTSLLQKTAGLVTVDGLDVVKDPAAIRKIIGYASQAVSVDDDLTGRENLRLQCGFHHLRRDEADKRIAEILKATALEEAADRRAGTYSGGMRKRLDLATAIITRPKLLFLDEPTTGLDPQNRVAMWEYIQNLNDQGTTIFLTTQYMEEADRLADRLCIVDQGKIVAEGTPAALKSEIGADVVSLALQENGGSGARDTARGILARLSGVQEIKDYDGGIMVFARSGPSLVPEIVRSLDAANVHIAQLSLSSPSLDDVFVKHTGRKLRVEEVKPVGRTPFGGRRRRPM